MPLRKRDFLHHLVDETLDEQIEGIVDVGYSHIGIKPSCFIDDVDQMGDFCEHIVKRLDSYFA